tara:strand:+ start:1635 stop:2168 length:534 start_codon:yes stop_codon:yes gene_type:complete
MREINNPGSGNCFFYAVAIGMYYTLAASSGRRPTRLTQTEVRQMGKTFRQQVVRAMRNRARNDPNYRMGLVAAEINTSGNHKVNNVSVAANAYLRRMSRDCVWGGHPESEMTHRLLQDMGFQGLVVYERIETKNGDVTYRRLKGMTGRLNHTKKDPVVKIVLHGVNQMGIHFTTLVD